MSKTQRRKEEAELRKSLKCLCGVKMYTHPTLACGQSGCTFVCRENGKEKCKFHDYGSLIHDATGKCVWRDEMNECGCRSANQFAKKSAINELYICFNEKWHGNMED